MSFADINKLILPKNSGTISFETDSDEIVEFLKSSDRVGIRRIANILAEMMKTPINSDWRTKNKDLRWVKLYISVAYHSIYSD